MIDVRILVVLIFSVGFCINDSSATQPAPIDVNVLVLNFDPMLNDGTNRLVRNVLGFNDPHALAAAHEQEVHDVSGGYVNFNIVGWQDINAIPVKQDGFSYTPDQYVNLWQHSGPFHDPDLANYTSILNSYVPVSAVNSKQIDEVWMFGGPYFGFHESAMAGPRSFAINGGVYSDYPSSRPIAVMGFNYERDAPEMLHSLGHRVESSVSHFFGGWNVQNPQTLWDKYTANVGQTISGAPYGVGSIHFPANGVQDYDYGNPNPVQSTAADWLNYPNFTGATAPISGATWGNTEDGYLRYWFSHLPRTDGVNDAAGKLNNWWRYVYDYDNMGANGLPKDSPSKGPNGHYYSFIPSQGINWQNARSAAQVLTLGGYTGHLVTITDQSEMDFVTQISGGREGWIGASDETSEGIWRWVTGPEQGQVFYENGAPVGYTSFAPGEPNGGTAENYLHMLGGNRWNDVSGDYPNNAGYIVEFSIIPGDYDLNGSVNDLDYQKWRQSFGSTTDLSADGNHNGVVDAADYVVWREHRGMSTGGTFAAIPEPVGFSSLAVAAAAVLIMRNRRKS